MNEYMVFVLIKILPRRKKEKEKKRNQNIH